MTNLERLQSNIGNHSEKSVSAFGTWLHYQLIEASKGYIKIKLTSRPEMGNPAKITHGGILSAISDEAMGIAVYSLDLPSYFVTINLNIDFLYGIPVGDEIIAEAKVIRAGKKLIHAECNILNIQNVLCAKAQSNLITTSVENANDYKKPN